MGKAIVLQLFFFTFVLGNIGCKSGVEIEQPGTKDTKPVITIPDAPLYVDSDILFTVIPGIPLSRQFHCIWTTDTDSVLVTVQNADTITATFSEPGLHHITVQVFDSSSSLVASLGRSFVISTPGIDSTKLISLRGVMLRIKGAFIRKNYQSSDDTIPEYGFNSTDVVIWAPILLCDQGSYYASSSSYTTHNETHSYGSSNSRVEIRFRIEDSGKMLTQFSASTYSFKNEQGINAEIQEASQSIDADQTPFVRSRGDSLEYHLYGENVKMALKELHINYSDAQRLSYNQSYQRYSCDSIDWNSKEHPAQLIFLLY
jgi:hypothetical protein